MLTGPIVISGSDCRLQSRCGTREGGYLHIHDVPGAGCRILYGPHLTLPAGHYRFQLKFILHSRGDGLVTVDLSRSGGRREFYLRRCFEWELNRGIIRISYQFQCITEAFEFRLYAGRGFEISVDQLSIETQAPDMSPCLR